MLKLPKLDKRTAVLWAVTGLIAGSISASLSDIDRSTERLVSCLWGFSRRLAFIAYCNNFNTY
jgi:hypothetical protein